MTSAAAGEPLVRLTGVNKWFGDLHVLQDIDLTIDRGEVVVVIGPSGSGKSTLCRTINRLESIEQGEISIDGTPLPAEGKALAALRSDVGMVFQSFNLFAHKTILENVMLGPMKGSRQECGLCRKHSATIDPDLRCFDQGQPGAISSNLPARRHAGDGSTMSPAHLHGHA